MQYLPLTTLYTHSGSRILLALPTPAVSWQGGRVRGFGNIFLASRTGRSIHVSPEVSGCGAKTKGSQSGESFPYFLLADAAKLFSNRNVTWCV